MARAKRRSASWSTAPRKFAPIEERAREVGVEAAGAGEVGALEVALAEVPEREVGASRS